MKKIVFILFMLFERVTAQGLEPSKTYVSTCYDKHECFSLSSGSYIMFNTANSELSIIVDFNKFLIGNDTLDEWLNDLSNSKLIFKGNLSSNNLVELTHHNSRTTIVNGVTLFNGISRSHSIELTLFEISPNGMLFKDGGNGYFDRVNANLQFSIMPKEFKIDKKPHHLKKVIKVAIYRGVVNEYKPEIETWLQN